MIAIGRDGENVVFFGSSKDGSLVQFRCDLDEAAAALRQLRAMLGEDAPAPAFPPTSSLMQPAPQYLSPIAPRHPAGLVTLATSVEDAAREAEERDRREIAARRHQEETRHAIARPAPNPEEASRQEARRLRVLAASAGGDDGDE